MNEEEKKEEVYSIPGVIIPEQTTESGVKIHSELPKENSILYETKDTEKADCCLKMPDDSMINARIHEGDIVFVHKQDTVNNGEIAAIILNDTASLKRFYYYKDKKFIVLRHDNPKYEDIILTEDGFDTIQIIGKAIAFQSKI